MVRKFKKLSDTRMVPCLLASFLKHVYQIVYRWLDVSYALTHACIKEYDNDLSQM